MDISVIIPTYCPQTYLWDCLNSLAKQTLEKKRFEVIIVLNGCQEPYYSDIIQHLTSHKELNNVRLLQTDTPGVSNARNIGLEAAKGNNICFIDDDDWVSTNYLENLLIAKKSPKSIVEANIRNYLEETKSYTEYYNYLTKAFEYNLNRKKISIISARSFFSSACCKLIPTALIGDRRFNVRFSVGEDSLFMAEISNQLDSIVLTSPDTYYFRRIRQQSATWSKTSLKAQVSSFINSLFQYTKIYISDIRHYNFLFFVTRYIAITMKFVRNLF